MTDGIKILITAIVIAAAGIIMHFINSARITKKLKSAIASKWGKPPEDDYKETDLSSISSYFKNIADADSKKYIIDDITWNDLDMDRVFKRINSTQSSIGEEYLYALIRQPSFDPDELARRQRMMDFFSKASKQRAAIQLILARLGKTRSIDVTDMLYDKKKSSTFHVYLYKALSAIAVLSIILAFANPSAGIPLLIMSFITNMTIYYKVKNDTDSQLEVLGYIVSIASCSKKLIDADIKELDDINSKLSEYYKKVKSINKRSFNLFHTSSDPFTEYAKIALLSELIDYETLSSAITKYHKELLGIYNCIGLLDALISIASYRSSIKYFCTPQLHKAQSGSKKLLEFDDIFHPLIEDPVSNSFKAERSALITGSNASGKSTFLKTTAINAIFAQTIYTCLAVSYSSSYFMIFSSMALKDSIVNNESYYMAEIKSLKRIIDSLNDEYPCLCFVDEVLRGTNTVERIAASSQVLHFLSKGNCLCIAATHDIELTAILSGYYENYHFQEHFTDNEISFDYKIYKGRSNTRNAIKLLKFMGYNEHIVKQAEEMAEAFTSDGSWSII